MGELHEQRSSSKIRACLLSDAELDYLKVLETERLRKITDALENSTIRKIRQTDDIFPAYFRNISACTETDRRRFRGIPVTSCRASGPETPKRPVLIFWTNGQGPCGGFPSGLAENWTNSRKDPRKGKYVEILFKNRKILSGVTARPRRTFWKIISVLYYYMFVKKIMSNRCW